MTHLDHTKLDHTKHVHYAYKRGGQRKRTASQKAIAAIVRAQRRTTKALKRVRRALQRLEDGRPTPVGGDS